VTRERIRKTKLVATLGPACDAPEQLADLIRGGMNVARLNFSHGSHEEHRKRLEALRQAAAEIDANVAVMLDTKGVKIRTGLIEGGAAQLADGQAFTLYTDGRAGNAAGVSVSYPGIEDELQPGSTILLHDGAIELRVSSIRKGEIGCEILRGGRLEDRKGVNLPGVSLGGRALLRESRADLLFAIEHDVDYVAASFVRSADDVLEIRRFLEDHGAQIPIIAKIENEAAVRNLETIVAVANGTMVARGDLGVEMPLEDVPIVQKRIIRTTVMNGKPVITATQMLDSMERNLLPTRAEVSDVANAILDGTSAVMLSGETAIGAYPVEAVRTMSALALRAEESFRDYGHLQKIRSEPTHVVTEAVSQAAITMAHHLDAAAVITLTESGFTSRAISKYRPDCPILAVTASKRVMRKLALNWGVTAVLFEGERSDEAMIAHGIRRGRELGCIERGDVVVATAGVNRRSGSTNLIRVVTAEE
jgi:pyruvate kinase